MSELGAEARALLDAARDGDEPAAGDRARVRAALGPKLAIGAAAAGAAVTAAATSSAGSAGASAGVGAAATGVGAAIAGAAPIGVGMKVLLVLGTVTAVGVGAVSYVESSPPSAPVAPVASVARSVPARVAPAPSPVASPRPAPSAPPAPSASSEPTPPAPSAPAIAPAPPAPAASATASTASIDREIELVREAYAAMQSGDGARALVLLDEHARRWPSGALAEEREAARVFALCSLGRTADARAAAKRFLDAHPQSPTAARVRASCGGSSF